jgi:hypothetical protein
MLAMTGKVCLRLKSNNFSSESARAPRVGALAPAATRIVRALVSAEGAERDWRGYNGRYTPSLAKALGFNLESSRAVTSEVSEPAPS